MKKTYAEVLKDTIDEETGDDAYVRMPTDKLIEGIAAITAHLQGSMPDRERVFNAAMRAGMRKELLRRDQRDAAK